MLSPIILVTFAASVLLCGIYRYLALRWQIIDIPNSRSAHTEPTPRGGGVGLFLALVVGVSMLSNLIVAGISGVVVHLGFIALRIDPALSSAVAVTTMTDVIGFLVYLGLATLAIKLIVGSL